MRAAAVLTLRQSDGGGHGHREAELGVRVPRRQADDGGLAQQVADALLHGGEDHGHRGAVRGRALDGRARLGHLAPDLGLHVGPLLLDLGQLARAGGDRVDLLQDVQPRAVLGHVRDARVEVVHQSVLLLLDLLHYDLHLALREIHFSLFRNRCHYCGNSSFVEVIVRIVRKIVDLLNFCAQRNGFQNPLLLPTSNAYVSWTVAPPTAADWWKPRGHVFLSVAIG